MGLDMYLEGEIYKSPYDKDATKLHDCFVTGIVIRIGYWRKSNQIHSWFVENVQNGVDNCEKFYVPQEKLEELLAICVDVLEHKGDTKYAEEALATKSGFFFGKTDYDEWYYEDLRETIKILEKAISLCNAGICTIYYHSSW